MHSFPSLQFSSTPGVAVYIGAGDACDLDAIRATGVSRIVLVEANPDTARALESRLGQDTAIEVVALAIGGFSGPGKLRLLNLPDYSSLRVPTGLQDLFPGLRQIGTADTDTYMAHELVMQLGLPEDESHLLIVDAPGVEEVILSSLIQQDLVTMFQHIILRGGAKSFYEGSKSVAELSRMLTDVGYRQTAFGGDDPDFLQAVLTWEPVFGENKTLRGRLEAVTGELAAAQDRIRELERQKTSEIAQIRAEHNAAWQAISARLKRCEADLEQKTTEAARLAAERDATHEQMRCVQGDLEDAKAEAQAQMQSARDKERKLRDALQTATSRLQNREAAVLQKNAEIKTLNAELEAACETSQKGHRSLENAQTRLQTLKKRMERQAQMLERKELDLGVALRSQAALQADLQAMRQKYETLITDKTEQDRLLLNVTSRLSAASDYLYMLQADSGAAPPLPHSNDMQAEHVPPAALSAAKTTKKPSRGSASGSSKKGSTGRKAKPDTPPA